MSSHQIEILWFNKKVSRKMPFNQVIAVECLAIVYIDKEIE